jgi:capsid portal protein
MGFKWLLRTGETHQISRKTQGNYQHMEIITMQALEFVTFVVGNDSYDVGRAIAQAVSRWLPTAAVRGSSPGLVM